MQTIKIDSVLRGFFQRPELWRIFYAFWAAMGIMIAGFLVALTVMPGLDVFAMFFPVLVFAGLCFWKLKDYKAKVVGPVDAVIRQADRGEQVGIFLFFSFFLGALGWGVSLLLMLAVYIGMTNTMQFDWDLLRYALFYGFILGAIMAAFKLADIFKQKKITYALYAVLALIFLFSL